MPSSTYPCCTVRAQDLLPLVRAWRLELVLACSPYVASHEFGKKSGGYSIHPYPVHTTADEGCMDYLRKHRGSPSADVITRHDSTAEQSGLRRTLRTDTCHPGRGSMHRLLVDTVSTRFFSMSSLLFLLNLLSSQI